MQRYSRIPREGTFAFDAFSASPSTLIRELKGQFDLPRPGVVAGFGPYRVVKDVESPPSPPRCNAAETAPSGTVRFPPLASRLHPGLAVADAPALHHPAAQIDNAPARWRSRTDERQPARHLPAAPAGPAPTDNGEEEDEYILTSGDRRETRVRPEFEPSALTPATFSVRRSSASIDLDVLSQARRQELPTGRVRKGVADEDSRPIIGLATVSPTNSIVLCRGRRARLGANHTKG